MLTVKKRKFGNAVKGIRQARQLTKTKLAESIGLDKEDVVAIEKGKRKVSEDEIKKLAKGLEIPDKCLVLFGRKPTRKEPRSLTDFVDSLENLALAVIKAQEHHKNDRSNGKTCSKKSV